MFEKVVREIQGVWGLESQKKSHCIGVRRREIQRIFLEGGLEVGSS